MSEKIEPALTAQQWDSEAAVDDKGNGVGLLRHENIPDVLIAIEKGAMGTIFKNVAGTIAIANDALESDDQRKITREKLDFLRQCVGGNFYPSIADLDAAEQFLDALESYLPPKAR